MMMQSAQSSSSHSGTGGTTPAAPDINPDQKILANLSTLSDQIALCQSMLVNAGGPDSLANATDADEALLTVIGFLEACVPRMVELIEAAAQGALDETTFEECLVVNDRLTNVLADVEKEPGDRTPLTPAAAAAAASSAGSASGGDSASVADDDNIHRDMNNLSVTGTGGDTGGGGSSSGVLMAGGKTTGLDSIDDPFAGGPDLLAPTPVPPAASFVISDSMGSSGGSAGAAAAARSTDAATKNDNDDDDFDAFFRDRTAAP